MNNEFPMKNKDFIYFNSAATSLKPNVVIDEISNYYKNYGVNTARGVDSLSYEVTKKYEEVRNAVTNFIDSELDEIVFTRGTTESINLVAHGIEHTLVEGDEIIVSIEEHHSNLIPWQELAKRKNLILKYIDVDNIYENLQNTITAKTKIVALNHRSNVLGELKDIKRLAEIVHSKNAIIVIDGAQGIVHDKVSMKNTNVDFYAFSGHKMYGPMGVGVLYGKGELLKELKPLLYGGEMINIVTKEKSTFKNAPHKFEGGTMMVPEVLGLGAAINYINKLDHKKNNEHIKTLRKYLIEEMKKLNVTIYNEEIDTSLITFNFNGIHSHDVSSVLDQDKIIIRAGHHCAALIHEKLKISSSIRISLGIYNDMEECKKLIDSLKKVGDYINVIFK